MLGKAASRGVSPSQKSPHHWTAEETKSEMNNAAKAAAELTKRLHDLGNIEFHHFFICLHGFSSNFIDFH